MKKYLTMKIFHYRGHRLATGCSESLKKLSTIHKDIRSYYHQIMRHVFLRRLEVVFGFCNSWFMVNHAVFCKTFRKINKNLSGSLRGWLNVSWMPDSGHLAWIYAYVQARCPEASIELTFTTHALFFWRFFAQCNQITKAIYYLLNRISKFGVSFKSLAVFFVTYIK